MKLDYFIYGHFHTSVAGMRWGQIISFLNGSFVTDDEFGEEHLAVGSVPEQLLLGVHPKYGVSWRYVLALK